MLMDNPPRFIIYFGGLLLVERGQGGCGWGCAGSRSATVSAIVGIITSTIGEGE